MGSRIKFFNLTDGQRQELIDIHSKIYARIKEEARLLEEKKQNAVGMKCHLCGNVITDGKEENASCQDCNIVYPICFECLENETGFECDCGGEVMIFGDY